MTTRFAKFGLFLGLILLISEPSWSQIVPDRSNVTAKQNSLLSFDVKVYLEAVYTGSSPAMAASISGEAYFPTSQPFSDSEFDGTPLSYGGSESIGGPVPAGVIDWILVEIRDDGTSRSDSVTSVAALLMEDGSIRDTDGTSLPYALVNSGSTHYVIVRSRNHMPVISSGSVDFQSSSPTQYDFTTAASQAIGANPMKDLGSAFGLYAADANGQDGISASDNSIWTVQNGGPDGYLRADFNLTGAVTASDFSFWVANNGLSSPVPGN